MPTVKNLGSWVIVDDRLPKTTGIKITQTKDNIFGIAIFHKDEWHHLLPSYMGEVYKWYEFVNSDGDEVSFVTDPSSTKEENFMKQSAGTIIVNEKGEILMGHVTNTTMPEIWDLPKGMVEPNESPIDAAIRECQEEFGISLEKQALTEIGNCKYNSQKNVWLFITLVEKEKVDLTTLKCDSMFMDSTGKEFPEIDAYRWVKFSDVPFDCAKSMVKLLHSLHERIYNFVRYGAIDKF